MASNERWGINEIKSRIQKWNTRYSEPPKINDWRLSGSDEDGAYPSEATVKAKFASWNGAIFASGLTPREVGRPTVEASTGTHTLKTNTAYDVSGINNNSWIPSNHHGYGGYGGYYTSTPNYWWENYCTCQGAQKKLDAVKAVLDADLGASREILLAILNA